MALGGCAACLIPVTDYGKKRRSHDDAQGDDPSALESALIGKPVPTFRLGALNEPGKIYDRSILVSCKPLLLNAWAT